MTDPQPTIEHPIPARTGRPPRRMDPPTACSPRPISRCSHPVTSLLTSVNAVVTIPSEATSRNFKGEFDAAVAEDEAKRISERTKAALQAAKARGVKLGSHRPGHWAGRQKRRQIGLHKARKASAESRRRQARERIAFLFPLLLRLRDEENLALEAIAERLNEEGYTTSTGKPWSKMAVSRALQMAREK